MELYADIIVDISHSRLDQTFQYRIPEEMEPVPEPGDVVEIPFGRGNRLIKGYVLRITDCPACAPEKLKAVCRRVTDFGETDSRLTALALWMRDYYGSTTIQALRTVLPFRSRTPVKKKQQVVLAVPAARAAEALAVFRKKHQAARARLLEALLEEPVLPKEAVTGSLRITRSVLEALREQGLIRCETEQVYRTPALLEQLRRESEEAKGDAKGRNEAGTAAAESKKAYSPVSGLSLTQEQAAVIAEICGAMAKEGYAEYLLHGVTGSGKTAVYMELIAGTMRRGRQAILLIPEISLTYQNVIRFYHAFGSRISILHSRLSQAERYDQFERARNGEIDLMIGPRSALFTPFPKLGLIVIDEEHEPSYQSETMPRYDARAAARKRSVLEGAKLVLGSATPSLESYYAARQGSCRLLTMKSRPGTGELPRAEIVDMRRELKDGNSSILSRALSGKIRDCLEKGQQMMLFLNRRGYAGFVSCRSCGQVIKCPHCDVSLSLHQGGRMVCHYCGYETAAVQSCPSCGSGFIGGFKAGTQQIEAVVSAAFPQARILRMDADTTRGKDGHAQILHTFGKHGADILIGTQMIVKGHDFPEVALVGVLAADLSLGVCDFRAAERTFQLLTQAAGRAGRAQIPGEVVIQTYQPDHYAVVCAAAQDYEAFYEQEIQYRRISGYPPVGGLVSVHAACEDPERLTIAMDYLAQFAQKASRKYQAVVMGPTDEAVARIRDRYRKALYIRHENVRALTDIKNRLEQYIEMNSGFDGIEITFER